MPERPDDKGRRSEGAAVSREMLDDLSQQVADRVMRAEAEAEAARHVGPERRKGTSVTLDSIKLIVSEHARTCPATLGYQKILGVAAAFTLVLGFIVWLGSSSIEAKVSKAVSTEFDRRMPAFRLIVGEAIKQAPPASWEPIPSAQAAGKK